MIEIQLPRLVGTRSAVHPFLRDVPDRLSGQRVLLDCRMLLSGTPSFADEFVKVVLRDRGADELVVIGANPDFDLDLRTAAQDHGVADRLQLQIVAATG